MTGPEFDTLVMQMMSDHGSMDPSSWIAKYPRGTYFPYYYQYDSGRMRGTISTEGRWNAEQLYFTYRNQFPLSDPPKYERMAAVASNPGLSILERAFIDIGSLLSAGAVIWFIAREGRKKHRRLADDLGQSGGTLLCHETFLSDDTWKAYPANCEIKVFHGYPHGPDNDSGLKVQFIRPTNYNPYGVHIYIDCLPPTHQNIIVLFFYSSVYSTAMFSAQATLQLMYGSTRQASGFSSRRDDWPKQHTIVSAEPNVRFYGDLAAQIMPLGWQSAGWCYNMPSERYGQVIIESTTYDPAPAHVLRYPYGSRVPPKIAFSFFSAGGVYDGIALSDVFVYCAGHQIPQVDQEAAEQMQETEKQKYPTRGR